MTAHVKPALRMASYNIRAALGTDLRRDRARMLAAIAGLRADLVVLQEADHRLGARPAALAPDEIAGATGLHPLAVAENGVSLGWHGIAMLARPGISALDIRRIDLPGLEPRGAVIADLATPLGQLRLAGVHLGLLRRSRRAQLRHIGTALADLPPLPTIVAGDFNEWSARKGLGRLARDFTILTPGRTFPASLPILPLDRIAHCPALAIRASTVGRSKGRAQASDHLPLLAEITTAGATARQDGAQPT